MRDFDNVWGQDSLENLLKEWKIFANKYKQHKTFIKYMENTWIGTSKKAAKSNLLVYLLIFYRYPPVTWGYYVHLTDPIWTEIKTNNLIGNEFCFINIAERWMKTCKDKFPAKNMGVLQSIAQLSEFTDFYLKEWLRMEEGLSKPISKKSKLNIG